MKDLNYEARSYPEEATGRSSKRTARRFWTHDTTYVHTTELQSTSKRVESGKAQRRFWTNSEMIQVSPQISTGKLTNSLEVRTEPDTDSMRLNCFFETGDERYKWLNKQVVIASSARCGTQGTSDTTIFNDMPVADLASGLRCLHCQLSHIISVVVLYMYAESVSLMHT